MKTYKTFHSFRNAVCKLVTKIKHDRVLPTLVKLGYAEKKVIEKPYQVTYDFPSGVSVTQEDVEKVVIHMLTRRRGDS